jgi:hypothetical protein
MKNGGNAVSCAASSAVLDDLRKNKNNLCQLCQEEISNRFSIVILLILLTFHFLPVIVWLLAFCFLLSFTMCSL